MISRPVITYFKARGKVEPILFALEFLGVKYDYNGIEENDWPLKPIFLLNKFFL